MSAMFQLHCTSSLPHGGGSGPECLILNFFFLSSVTNILRHFNIF